MNSFGSRLRLLSAIRELFSFPIPFRLREMKIHAIRCVNDEQRRTMQWRNQKFGAHKHFSRLFFSAVWQLRVKHKLKIENLSLFRWPKSYCWLAGALRKCKCRMHVLTCLLIITFHDFSHKIDFSRAQCWAESWLLSTVLLLPIVNCSKYTFMFMFMFIHYILVVCLHVQWFFAHSLPNLGWWVVATESRHKPIGTEIASNTCTMPKHIRQSFQHISCSLSQW